MIFFLKYIGIFILLIGVAVLAVPFWGKVESNESLMVGLCLVLTGFIIHILINKKTH